MALEEGKLPLYAQFWVAMAKKVNERRNSPLKYPFNSIKESAEMYTTRQYGDWTIEYVRRTDCPCICCSKPLIHKATLTKDLKETK